MKIRVTEAGVYDQNGDMIEVGTVLTIRAEDMPASFLNKAVVVDEAKTKVKAPVFEAQKSEQRLELEKQAADLELTYDAGVADDVLKAMIDAKLAG